MGLGQIRRGRQPGGRETATIKVDRLKDRQIGDRQIVRQIDRQKDRQIVDRQIEKQINSRQRARQKETQGLITD